MSRRPFHILLAGAIFTVSVVLSSTVLAQSSDTSQAQDDPFILDDLLAQAPVGPFTVDDLLMGRDKGLSNIDLTDFRATYIQYLLTMSDDSMTGDLVDAQVARIESLSDADLEELIRLFPNPEMFLELMKQRIDLVNAAKARAEEAGADGEPEASSQSAIRVTKAHTTLPAPDYGFNTPGSEYKSVFLDFLATNNFIPNNTSNAARCDNEAFSTFTRTLTILRVANSAGSAACQLAGCDPVGFVCGTVCGLDAILDTTTEIVELTEASCNTHNGTIDSAEIEAAYENSIIISGQVHDLDTDLVNHNTAISNQLTTHDTDIKTQLTTHDTDIKGLLAGIKAVVDANGVKLDTVLARQLEVVRLLHTPNGRRATDVPACNGGPCTWNNR